MYADLAEWWPLLSPPSVYEEEAAELRPLLLAAADAPPVTLLELGAGGGSLAYHLKNDLQLTLNDLSPDMLAVSRVLNPECAHVAGDMRTLDLAGTFDLVLINDAIMYATTPADAGAVIATAARHCRPGGGLMLIPDFVAETFEADENTGECGTPDGRGLRYVERKWDPDPRDDTYETVYDFTLRHADSSLDTSREVHHYGLFPRASWLAWLTAAGFAATSRLDPWGRDVFIGRKARH
jgi:SAM-dependent methyltransferase